jgi:hypothetical protein
MFISDAISRLADGMWGGLRRPAAVGAIKKSSPKVSIGFGPQREEAGRRIRAAATNAKLVVYVAPNRQVRAKSRSQVCHPPGLIEPTVVPISVVKRLITTSRGSLPDQPIRPSLKATEDNQKLLALLISGLLAIRMSDFDVWYRSERHKGKWPSQRSMLKSHNGRPTKQTEALSGAILALVYAGTWNGKASFTKLHQLLVDSGRPDVPSPDTLVRLVDQLHRETGNAALFRIARARRKRT